MQGKANRLTGGGAATWPDVRRILDIREGERRGCPRCCWWQCAAIVGWILAAVGWAVAIGKVVQP